MKVWLIFQNGILREIKIKDSELTILVECDIGVINLRRRIRRTSALTAFFIRNFDIDKILDFVQDILNQGLCDLRVVEIF